jgi:hypothetical protein
MYSSTVTCVHTFENWVFKQNKAENGAPRAMSQGKKA